MQFKISFTMVSGNVYTYLANFDSRAAAAATIKDAVGRNVITFDNEDIIACRNIERVQITEAVQPTPAATQEEKPDVVVRSVLPEVPESDGKLGAVHGRKRK